MLNPLFPIYLNIGPNASRIAGNGANAQRGRNVVVHTSFGFPPRVFSGDVSSSLSFPSSGAHVKPQRSDDHL